MAMELSVGLQGCVNVPMHMYAHLAYCISPVKHIVKTSKWKLFEGQ